MEQLLAQPLPTTYHQPGALSRNNSCVSHTERSDQQTPTHRAAFSSPPSLTAEAIIERSSFIYIRPHVAVWDEWEWRLGVALSSVGWMDTLGVVSPSWLAPTGGEYLTHQAAARIRWQSTEGIHISTNITSSNSFAYYLNFIYISFFFTQHAL